MKVKENVMLRELAIIDCDLCGKTHGKTMADELSSGGWYVGNISHGEKSAQQLICPDCVKRMFGRRVSVSEFEMPIVKKRLKLNQDELPLFKDIPKTDARRNYNR
jgi:hypothetical protein